MAGNTGWFHLKDAFHSKEGSHHKTSPDPARNVSIFHLKDAFHSKEGSHHKTSPDPASISGFTRPPNRLDPDFLGFPHGVPPQAMMIEQKLATQDAEIQRLVGENQRLAVTHVALRREIVAAQQEILRLRQSKTGVDPEKEQRFTITQLALRQELADAKQEVNRLDESLKAMHSEKEVHTRGNMEKMARMEADLKATESFRADFEKIRYERDELVARLEHMGTEFKKSSLKEQEIASLKREVDELRQRHQQARLDFELQKKISFERLEQNQAMEKNVFTMAREIEKLRAELAHAERKVHDAMLASSAGGTVAVANSATPVLAYENNVSAQQGPAKAAAHGMANSNSEDRVPRPAGAGNPGVEWTRHTARDGRVFYYNTVTGATQWDKPSSMNSNAVDPYVKQSVPSEMTNFQQQPHYQQQSPAAMPPQNVQGHPAQYYGVNLFVLGVSEQISDRDLGSLFLPYGRVLYAKVVVENKSGVTQCYGVITMESLQAAEAAASAVNGMLLLGRQIKIEIQRPRDVMPQQVYAQQPPPMQQQPQAW